MSKLIKNPTVWESVPVWESVSGIPTEQTIYSVHIINDMMIESGGVMFSSLEKAKEYAENLKVVPYISMIYIIESKRVCVVKNGQEEKENA